MSMDGALLALLKKIEAVEQTVGHFRGIEVSRPLQRSATSLFSGTRAAAGYADVDSTNGKITLTTTGGDVLVFFFGSASNTAGAVVQAVALRMDSGSDVAAVSVYSYAGLATYPVPFCTAALFTGVSAGSHSFYARHANTSAVGTMTTSAYLIAVDFRT
jgi:hypothetical protein